jgi:ribosome-associated heat shock protein Hsp15
MPAEGRQRIDKWLFFARVVKSRTLAARTVAEGRVRLNRDKVEEPARTVKPGDVLTLRLERRILVLKVVQPGMRRGPAEEARRLYEDLTPGAGDAAGNAAAPNMAPAREPGAGRPTKKERRALDRLRD